MNALEELKVAIENLQHHYENGSLERTKAQLLALLDRIPVPRADANPSHERLSPRENEVMTMLLSGRRLKEIAAQLDISVKTVTTHRSRLLRKLGVEDNLGLYRYGIRNGLIGV